MLNEIFLNKANFPDNEIEEKVRYWFLLEDGSNTVWQTITEQLIVAQRCEVIVGLQIYKKENFTQVFKELVSQEWEIPSYFF